MFFGQLLPHRAEKYRITLKVPGDLGRRRRFSGRSLASGLALRSPQKLLMSFDHQRGQCRLKLGIVDETSCNQRWIGVLTRRTRLAGRALRAGWTA